MGSLVLIRRCPQQAKLRPLKTAARDLFVLKLGILDLKASTTRRSTMLNGFRRQKSGLARLKVLVVDDSAKARAVITTVLIAAGHACIEAADGDEALGCVLDGGIDLIVTDLEMPGANGFQLISAVNLLPAARRPPIVVVSACLQDEDYRQRAELRTATRLLAKPVSPAVLLTTIDDIVWNDNRCVSAR